MDQYSRWHLPELVRAVGEAGVALIEESFPGQEIETSKARETALRSHGAGAGCAACHSQGTGRKGGCRRTGDNGSRGKLHDGLRGQGDGPLDPHVLEFPMFEWLWPKATCRALARAWHLPWLTGTAESMGRHFENSTSLGLEAQGLASH